MITKWDFFFPLNSNECSGKYFALISRTVFGQARREVAQTAVAPSKFCKGFMLCIRALHGYTAWVIGSPCSGTGEQQKAQGS